MALKSINPTNINNIVLEVSEEEIKALSPPEQALARLLIDIGRYKLKPSGSKA